MPCHHTLEAYLDAYLDVPRCRPIHRAAVPDDRTWYRATERYFPAQATVYAKIQCNEAAAGIVTKIGNHTFRATDITAYPENVNHASTRTTQLTTGITRASALTRWSGFVRSYDRLL